jgi:hypothetical protein
LICASRLTWMCLARHDIDKPLMDHDYTKDFAAPEIYATRTLSEATVIKFRN